jgi:hypothetical protein
MRVAPAIGEDFLYVPFVQESDSEVLGARISPVTLCALLCLSRHYVRSQISTSCSVKWRTWFLIFLGCPVFDCIQVLEAED